MGKNISNKWLAVCCILALFSCKSKKHLVAVKPDTATVKPAVDNSKANKLIAIRAKQIDFNTFSGKARTKLTLDGKDNDVTLNIRIKKNQKIWVSITAIVGIEVARAVITPDSIKVINRLQNVYLKKPFSYIYQYTGKQINYKTVESLLTGNAVPEFINEDATLNPDNGNIALNGTLQELVYQLALNADLKVTKLSMTNTVGGQSVQVNNGQFVAAANRVLPSQININTTAKNKNIVVDMHYIKVDFDQNVDFPFTIPGRYSIAN
jgi:hypothetical protein